MRNQIIFAHCNYKPFDTKDNLGNFSMTYCSLKSRKYAFAYRHYRLEKEEDICIDRHEQVDCHEYLTKISDQHPWPLKINNEIN